MALRKIKLGALIKESNEKNNNALYSLGDVKGISIKKVFIETKADMEGVSLKPYLLVKPDFFAYVTVTSRNGDKITLAHNTTNNTYIVSSSYVVFYINRPDLIDSDYLFMYFNRPEFDRFSRFNSWGSAREVFSFDDLCDIELEIPDLDTQKKYVSVYKSLKLNEECYETGLEDLKLICDSFIENLKQKYTKKSLRSILVRRNEKNDDELADYWGISGEGFIKPKQDLSEGNILHKKKFYLDDFIFTPSGVNLHNKSFKTGVCSHVNEMFYSVDEEVLTDYLELWFKRAEFYRYCDFFNVSSVMSNFDYDTFTDYFIPIPPIEVQQSIVNLYTTYVKRKELFNSVKNTTKNACSILIKGSLLDAKEI